MTFLMTYQSDIHLGGKDPEMLPSCHPPMPGGSDLLEQSGLQKLVLELASFLDAGPFFTSSHGLADSSSGL